ncbi:ankyrin repeat-containing domain protein [Podospora conica]|nr:ankyrin repeat-containing domain protein [Schizothecium conicum]
MASQLTEDEIDDLLYSARIGDNADLTTTLSAIAARTSLSPAEILLAARDESKATCLHMATGNGHLETVTLLLSHFAGRPAEEKTAFLDAPNEFANTGLHWAALGGHLEVVKALVEAGAAVAKENDKGQVPLDLAMEREGEGGKVVEFFLKQAGMREEENAEGGLSGGAEGVTLDGDEVNGVEGEAKVEGTV